MEYVVELEQLIIIYHYRFNVVKGYCGDKIIYFKNLISYFYTFEELSQLLNMVKNARKSKIKKYGFENYKMLYRKRKTGK